MGDFVCDKCPRSFKLEEFYEKHKKVHELKKQHRCDVCGFVYGAAKGLEGHLKTHSPEELSAVKAETEQASPPHIKFHFLSRQGVLTQPQPETAVAEASRVRHNDLADEMALGGKSQNNTGTGNYQIYDSVPEINESVGAYQNDSGFFACSVCSREFSGLNSLKKHVPIHTRRVQHQCDTCGHVFGKKEYLLDHMRKHTGEISPVCDVCGQTFNKSLKLKEHYKLHRNLNVDGSFHKALPFRCHMCKEVFQQASVLGMHLTTAHAETLYRCDMCDATFGDVRGKNHHMYNEHQMDAFHQKCVWCPVCSQGFTRHYNLKVHMYKAHGKEFIENNFSEAELEALFKSPPSTSSSKSSSFMSPSENFFTRGGAFVPSPLVVPAANAMKPLHYFDQKKGTQVLSCQLCSEAFFRRSDLLIHLEGDHQIKLLCCLACGEKFMDLLELRDHSVDVHGLNTSVPKRDASDASRKRKAPSASAQAALRRPGPASRTNAPQESRGLAGMAQWEMTDASAAGSVLKCNECGKVLQHKQSLASHMREEHGKHFGDNRWKGNAIVEKILDESVKKSPKKKPGNSKGLDANATMCSVCEQVFPNPSSLRNHVVNVHINGQNHTCDLCGKAYLHKENLDEHIKSKHPDLHNRLQKLRDSLGVDGKKLKLDIEEDSSPTSESFGSESKDSEAAAMESETKLASDEQAETEEAEDYYEPITQSIFHAGQVIHPCYVILPYVTDEEVERITAEPSQFDWEAEEAEEGKLTIDLDRDEVEEPSSMPGPKSKKKMGKQLQDEFVSEQLYNADDIKTDSGMFAGYPNHLVDFSAPISLSSLIMKKMEKMDVLPPETLHQIEMMEKINEIRELNASAREKVMADSGPKSGRKEAKDASSRKAAEASHDRPLTQTVVSDYETQVQNDHWPTDCIKCDRVITSLDDFNQHMNDHWSEDKCCPVCGLLINSKRFNFKQHLKIHTGEKPFVCSVCSRSFRQKAHMVKHVTTHRNMSPAQVAKALQMR